MIVDLSHAYRSGMQVYPGTPEVFIETTNPGPWKCLGLHLSTHAGTHIDAPSHFDPPGGATIDQFPLERFVGPGVVYHVSPVDDDQPIRLENLSPEFPLQDQSNLFLILRTGWDQYWGSERYMRNPYLAPELAQAIADTGGVGDLTTGSGSTTTGLSAHEISQSSIATSAGSTGQMRVLGLENLADGSNAIGAAANVRCIINEHVFTTARGV